jgi:hypothetical protein
LDAPEEVEKGGSVTLRFVIGTWVEKVGGGDDEKKCMWN